MKIDDHNKLTEKAKTRKNGVYVYKGYMYAIKSHHFIAFADPVGNLFVVSGIFRAYIGKCGLHERKKKLMKYVFNN